LHIFKLKKDVNIPYGNIFSESLPFLFLGKRQRGTEARNERDRQIDRQTQSDTEKGIL
jgi:hypothetical protein